MVALIHAIKISAPPAETFRALTDIQEMAAWHLGTVDGAIEPGGVLILTPRPGIVFRWRTEQVEPGERIVQTCLEDPGNTGPRTLTITVSDNGDGRSRVDLVDDGWPEGNPHLSLCNTSWGEALGRLRAHLERAA